ncbi:MAG: class I SAM-dependent methyltransferase [Ktedonobacteraceae bacterium]
MSEKATHEQLLASTARWTAAVRARESLREDRLFHDPWASALAGKEGQEWIEHKSDDSVVAMVLRTRFFDDFLQRISDQYAIRQIVLMAAGLDTRPFRLKWPAQTQLFELDQPAVLKYKEQVLTSAGVQPNCERHMIAADLTSPWKESLIKAGFIPQQPSAWLLEGFLFYLPNESITNILDEITNLAAIGSWIGFDIINSVTLTSPWTRPWIEMQAQAGAPWIGTMDDPESFLATRGWVATLTQVGENDANFSRWLYPVLPGTMLDMPRD